MNILLDHPGVLITEVLPLLHGFFDNEGWNDDLHRFCDHLLRTTFGEFDETVGIHYNFHVSKCNLFDTTCQVSDNFILVEDHGERLKNVYPDRYEHQFGYYRPITEEVFFRYLDCGILRYGFARIRCDHCYNEYLLAFSCKTRAFCPSCHFSLR